MIEMPDFYDRMKLKYPKLFDGVFISFGCGEGWEPIVESVLEKLDKMDCEITVAQVKEKFGGLRIYVNNGTDEAFEIINEAEKNAAFTCEMCGITEGVEKGSKYTGGWIKNYCKECHLKSKIEDLKCSVRYQTSVIEDLNGLVSDMRVIMGCEADRYKFGETNECDCAYCAAKRK
jgi:hypothetical protein